VLAVARLNWNATGERIYEAGVDRGVFYPAIGPGIAWNGLINVKEDPSVEVRPTFVDGVPYRSQKTITSFAAVLQAYTCPREFEEYDGSNGQQRRKAFGLSYRTGVGNDISADHSYKIHLVYNALAMPVTVDNSTLNSSRLDATPFSWGISTTPVQIPGAKPAAHLIIDPTIAYPEALAAIEAVLYGSDDGDARLPDIEELLDLFEQHAILTIIDHGDGTWTAIGPDDVIRMTSATSFEISYPTAVYIDEDTYQISSL
jgi:hypothetical protein